MKTCYWRYGGRFTACGTPAGPTSVSENTRYVDCGPCLAELARRAETTRRLSLAAWTQPGVHEEHGMRLQRIEPGMWRAESAPLAELPALPRDARSERERVVAGAENERRAAMTAYRLAKIRVETANTALAEVLEGAARPPYATESAEYAVDAHGDAEAAEDGSGSSGGWWANCLRREWTRRARVGRHW